MFVGSWTATLTEEDLRDAGISDPPLIRENAGVMTLTFTSEGTWTHSLETDVAVAVAVIRGTYRATGAATIEMRTTFPPELVGELIDVSWAVDGSALMLEAIDPPDPLIDIQFETHPWHPKH